MKRITAISFLLIFLCANTELGQLLKLPVLVHHYFEHNEDHKHITFFSFLKNHYTDLHKTASNHHKEDHQQLPFKSHENNFIAQSSSILPPVNCCIEPLALCLEEKMDFISTTRFNSLFLANIWQPPKA